MSHRLADTADSLADQVRELAVSASAAFREGYCWGILSGAILGAVITWAIIG